MSCEEALSFLGVVIIVLSDFDLLIRGGGDHYRGDHLHAAEMMISAARAEKGEEMIR